MESLGEADRKNIINNIIKVDDALATDARPKLKLADLKVMVFKPLGIETAMSTSTYNSMDPVTYKKWWDALPLPRNKPVKEKAAPKGVEAPTTSSVATPASVVAYRCSSHSHTKVMNDVIRSFIAYNPKIQVREIMDLMSTMLGHMADLRSDELWGELHAMTAREYVGWQRMQRTNNYVLGPLSFWNYLKKLGLAYTILPSNVPGRDFISYSRHGVEIRCYDRFRVDNLKDTGPMPDAEVDRFLDNLRKGGKPVKYANILTESYMLAAAVCTKYAFTSQKGKISVSLINQGSAGNPNMLVLDGSLGVAVDKVVAVFKEHPFEESDAVMIFEKLARLIEQYCKVDEDLEEEMMCMIDPLESTMLSYMDVFDTCMNTDNPKIRIKEFDTAFRANTNVHDSLLKLDAARDVRNVGSVTPIVNHNVASVHGTHFPEWVDTVEKAHNIVYALRSRFKVAMTDTDKLVIAGIAHGHMTDVLVNGLAANDQPVPNDRLMLVDKVRAKNSPATFVEMDVFLYDEKGRWIIDDANAHKVTEAYKLQRDTKNSQPNGDIVRATNYLRLQSPVIVMKAQLGSFRTDVLVNQWMTLWHEHPDYIFRVTKFGKLHNPEVFVVLIKSDTKQYRTGGLATDLASISLCVQTANAIIMKWHSSGYRAFFDPLFSAHHDITETYDELSRTDEIDVDERPDGSNPYIAPSLFWLSLVNALPAKWPWYAAVRSGLWKREGGSDVREADIDDIVIEVDDFSVTHVDDIVVEAPVDAPVADVVPSAIAAPKPVTAVPPKSSNTRSKVEKPVSAKPAPAPVDVVPAKVVPVIPTPPVDKKVAK